MEWGTSRIMAVLKHAGMTQAKFAQWLGVSIKQVKYLEHQRRNPSGPTRRLLDILAVQIHFNGTGSVLVLGTDTTHLTPPVRNAKPPMAGSAPRRDDESATAKPTGTVPGPEAAANAPEPTATPAADDDDAFVWR